jgi:hypothetical protein
MSFFIMIRKIKIKIFTMLFKLLILHSKKNLGKTKGELIIIYEIKALKKNLLVRFILIWLKNKLVLFVLDPTFCWKKVCQYNHVFSDFQLK